MMPFSKLITPFGPTSWQPGVPSVYPDWRITPGTPILRVSVIESSICVSGRNGPKIATFSKRHIHMTPREASLAHVKDNDEVFVITQSFERGLIFADVVVRVSPKFKLAMHVDTDEANAFGSDSTPTGAILKLFDGQTYSLQQWADEVASGINR